MSIYHSKVLGLAILAVVLVATGCAHPPQPDQADQITIVESDDTQGCTRIEAQEVTAHGYPPGSGIRNAARTVALEVGGDTAVLSDERQTGLHWWTFTPIVTATAIAYDCHN